jgi:hypothetical protein
MDISDDRDRLRELLSSARTIAVVGASDKPDRPSHQVGAYLISAGYDVIPVNPTRTVIFGKMCHPDLRSIPVPVDIVDIFRNPADVPPIVEEAIAIVARCIWMQSGISHPEAARRTLDAGRMLVQDRCLMSIHRLLRI